MRLTEIPLLLLVTLVLTEAKSSQPHTTDSYVKRQVLWSCGPHAFLCQNGRECIQAEYTCDTESDCADGSDELHCPTDCSGPHQFKCDNGDCIPIEYRCNNHQNCYDNSDELDCDKFQCTPSEIKCDNHICIVEYSLCDGYDDCGNGWDERDCANRCKSEGKFFCVNGHRCIETERKCDGYDDCSDGSDESGCLCSEEQFQCTSGRCILKSWVCNGNDDCIDAIDELQCPTIHPSLCSNRLSILDCALMNTTTTPICLHFEDGFKFCRKYCGLCLTT